MDMDRVKFFPDLLIPCRPFQALCLRNIDCSAAKSPDKAFKPIQAHQFYHLSLIFIQVFYLHMV